jgi:hypothetical protein
MNPLSQTQLSKLSAQLHTLSQSELEEKLQHMLKEPKVTHNYHHRTLLASNDTLSSKAY